MDPFRIGVLSMRSRGSHIKAENRCDFQKNLPIVFRLSVTGQRSTSDRLQVGKSLVCGDGGFKHAAVLESGCLWLSHVDD